MKLKPGMIFEYAPAIKQKNDERELLIIINIFPLPLEHYGPGCAPGKRLIVYKVEDSRLHLISSYSLLKYYKPLSLNRKKEKREGEKKT